MAQTQLFQIWRELPGTVHFAALFIDDVNRAGKILIGVERNRKRQNQSGCAIELNFRGIEQRERFTLTLRGEFRELIRIRFGGRF
ncbi:hypothetical protein D3C72_589650 [compost metagenome]